MMDEFVNDNSKEMEWENRSLCSDGNCIGVIGPDGRCNECGKPGTESTNRIAPEAVDLEVHVVPEGDPAAERHASAHSEETETDDQNFDDPEWENRSLCDDGNCIGVIGSDGRCNECGRPAAEALE
jgi:hypothetical protein